MSQIDENRLHQRGHPHTARFKLLQDLAVHEVTAPESNASRERIRALITRVRLTPDDGATNGYKIDLEGDLAGILALAAGAKTLARRGK